ncbi:hypothetical protein TWF481_008119 [Arthrobotrys musiformis]|uniref:F-box domain-containing protein n=1 Tax=Arthrobotrys musiformis TaxID=47236 RepID=A0AAV9WBZ0_9PEZI
MSLDSMPTEILLSIFSPLEFEDLVCLLPTCRHVRQAAFHCLAKAVDEKTAKSITEFQSDASERGSKDTVPLEDVRVLRGSGSSYKPRGLHIEFTVVDRDNEQTTESTGYDINHFLDIVNIGIQSGAMDISKAAVYLSKPVSDDRGFRELFIALKHYSRTRLPFEFSITSLASRLKPARMMELFDTEKLTKLTIYFKKRHSDYEKDKVIANEIKDFQKLLNRVTNLEHLEVLLTEPVGGGFDLCPPVSVVTDADLEGLKKGFFALKKLHTFKLEAFLFYSSFFIPIPENVRTLSLSHVAYYSRSWWDEFAKYPFKNLENLELKLCSDEENCLKKCGVDIHLSPFWKSDWVSQHTLGGLEIRGLKTFNYQHMYPSYLPSDLVMSVMGNNPGLDEDTRRRFAQDYGTTLIRRCKEELMQAIASKIFEEELGKGIEDRFFANGIQKDDLEKCTLDYLSKFSEFLTKPVSESKLAEPEIEGEIGLADELEEGKKQTKGKGKEVVDL